VSGFKKAGRSILIDQSEPPRTPSSSVPAAALRASSPVESTVAVFEPLSFDALTSCYAFRVTAAKDKLELTCGFVLNLPLLGAPVDRPKRLLLSLLRNREQLLKYLLILLADDEESARRLVAAYLNHCSKRWIYRQPSRLGQIARLIDGKRIG
jgi:hypothetical protein